MTKLLIYLIMAVIMAASGAQTMLKGIRAVRKSRKYPDALMYWEERPGGLQGDDPMSWLGITIHRLALIAIAVISALVILREAQAAPMPFPVGGGWQLAAGFLAYVAAGMAAFFAGFVLCGPVAEYIGGDRHYAVSQSGLLMASQHFPWDTFSYFELDTKRKRVTLWSASLPGAAALVATFVDEQDAQKLADILAQHLPASRPAGMKFQPWAFPLRMLLLCLPCVAAAWLLMVAPIALALSVNVLLTWLLLVTGGQLIARLIYGDKGRAVKA